MTSVLQYTLEHLHITAGLPWWGAIGVTAIATRAILVPFFIRSADQNARAMALVAVTKPASDRMKAAQAAGDQTAMMQAWAEVTATRKSAGLSYFQQFAPMILQAYIGYCGFRLLSAMAHLPVQSLHTGGLLWLQDLTIPDGYLLLPVMMGGAIHMMQRWGGEMGTANADLMTPAMRNSLMYGMPVIITIITGFQPGAVAVWFAFTGAWGMAQAKLLQSRQVREFLDITPLYKPAKKPTPTPQPAASARMPLYQAPTLRTSPTAPRASALDVRAKSVRNVEPIAREVEPEAPPAAPAASSNPITMAQKWFKDKMEAQAKKTEGQYQARKERDYEQKYQERERLSRRGGRK
jgi:YidC/Oxa1 family membrane protein insertase